MYSPPFLIAGILSGRRRINPEQSPLYLVPIFIRTTRRVLRVKGNTARCVLFVSNMYSLFTTQGNPYELIC